MTKIKGRVSQKATQSYRRFSKVVQPYQIMPPYITQDKTTQHDIPPPSHLTKGKDGQLVEGAAIPWVHLEGHLVPPAKVIRTITN